MRNNFSLFNRLTGGGGEGKKTFQPHTKTQGARVRTTSTMPRNLYNAVTVIESSARFLLLKPHVPFATFCKQHVIEHRKL